MILASNYEKKNSRKRKKKKEKCCTEQVTLKYFQVRELNDVSLRIVCFVFHRNLLLLLSGPPKIHENILFLRSCGGRRT